MNSMGTLFLSTFILVVASHGHEESGPSEALFFDKPVAIEMAIRFEIEEDLYPTRSSFEILDFAFLSDEAGERWALAVVYNNVREPRIFTENQLIGSFASGNASWSSETSDKNRRWKIRNHHDPVWEIENASGQTNNPWTLTLRTAASIGGQY